MVKVRRTKKSTHGFIARVPCPWCKRPNNCTGLQPSDGAGWGGYGLEKAERLDCDHCGHTMEVIEVRQATIVRVRQYHGE
ncbi:MAG: hypothetical protein KJO40_19500 [Deltaproteobacteria bacterium]|nr:hypothetical protein [Deltaproteobacteria bacterium]